MRNEMMSEIKDQEHKRTYYSIREQKCTKVVVFADRAEVGRSLKAILKKGENELIINSISSSIDKDSIRVEGRGSDAVVLDVVCQEKRVESTSADNISDKEKELKSEIESLETKKDFTNYKLERVNKQIGVLNEFANSLSKLTVKKDEKDESNSATNVSSFLSFLDTYSDKLEVLDESKYKLEKELEKLSEQINVSRENLNKLTAGNYKENM
jgi:hypothetical protein